jgi:hypothetical protein
MTERILALFGRLECVVVGTSLGESVYASIVTLCRYKDTTLSPTITVMSRHSASMFLGPTGRFCCVQNVPLSSGMT